MRSEMENTAALTFTRVIKPNKVMELNFSAVVFYFKHNPGNQISGRRQRS